MLNSVMSPAPHRPVFGKRPIVHNAPRPAVKRTAFFRPALPKGVSFEDTGILAAVDEFLYELRQMRDGAVTARAGCVLIAMAFSLGGVLLRH